VLAAGNLMNASAGIGQQLQKQIGPETGIPRVQRRQCLRDRCHALRTAIMAVKAGEVDYGLAVGVEKARGRRSAGRRGQEEGRRHLDTGGPVRSGGAD